MQQAFKRSTSTTSPDPPCPCRPTTCSLGLKGRALVCTSLFLQGSSLAPMFVWLRGRIGKVHCEVALCRDWMNLYEGRSQVALRPKTTQQVSQVRRLG